MKKKLLTVVFICFVYANFYAQSTANESLKSFTNSMASWIQENSMTLNTTADAYIGKIVPSIPPHFQVGLSFATTIIDTAPISKAAESIKAGNGNIGFGKVFIMPTYSINLRFGGFYLPFDIGLFGTFTLPPQGSNFNFGNSTVSVNQMNLGFDIRYAISEGKKEWPKISIGIGYFYNRHSYEFGIASSGTKTSFGTNLGMHTLYVQLQASKQFSFLLPYLGIRAALSKTDNEYFYSTGAAKTTTSTNTNFDIKEIQPQIYAGLGFMIPYSQVTLNGAYNPRRNQFSVSVHASFRL